MALMRITSPHAHRPLSTGGLMRYVLLATVPGIIALTYFFGWGNIINIIYASVVAVIAESLCLLLRKRRPAFYLKDCSALVTAVLLGIALPPYAPFWLVTVAILFAIVIAKQLYGGMGFNPFNPAMVGYVVVLISFPLQMTQWSAPLGMTEALTHPSFMETLQINFGGLREGLDAFTAATPLDVFKQAKGMTSSEVFVANPQFGTVAGLGWEWVNLCFLGGGLFLLSRGFFTWHAPVGMLGALVFWAAIFSIGGGSDSLGSPFFHLFSGATMLGAFFIITDPVTSATSNRGRLIYGLCIGSLLYAIRTLGNYPDAIAFAVLLMNFAAPLIDHYVQPKTYGHNKPKKPQGGKS